MSANKFEYHPTKAWGDDRIGFYNDYQKQLAEYNSGKQHAVTIVEAGHEVPLESVVKMNANGHWSKQSTLGKVVALIEDLEGEVKAGKSVYEKDGMTHEHVWLEGVANRKRVQVVGADILVQGVRMKFVDAEALLRGE